MRTTILAFALAASILSAPIAADDDGASSPTLAVLSAQTLFERNSFDLDQSARQGLEALLARLEALDTLLSVRVIGHADSRGAVEYNRALTERRAEAIAALVRKRFPGTRVIAVGAGESSPIAENTTEAGRILNRRVEIQVIGAGTPPLADSSVGD